MILENQANNKGWMPDDASFNHEPEQWVVCRLNKVITNPHILVERVPDKYAPDIGIFFVNSDTLEKTLLFQIEAEEKRKIFELDMFSKPIWPYREWSFLARKVEKKDIFLPQDIYVLTSKDESVNIFWTTFESIRNHCERWVRKTNNPKEVYYRTPVTDTSFVMENGYESLAHHIEDICQDKNI